MHAVAQFVRQRHHVARLAEIVEHHIGVDRGDGRMREGPRRLARFHARVDPALVEEGLRQIGHARVEGGVGLAHRRARLKPVHCAGRFGRQGRVAVPDLQFLQPHPLRLEAIVAVGKLRIGRDDSVAQRLHHFRFHMVRQVPPGLRGGHLAPAVVDFLFLRQRVVDAGEKLDVRLEHPGQGMRRRLAPRPHRVGEEVQRGFQVQLFRLSLDGEHQPRHRLVEKLVPGGGPHHGLIVEKLLQLVRQLVRPHRAHPVEDRLVAGKVGIGGQQPGQMVVVQPVEFEREEHQRRGGSRHLVLRISHELRAFGVDGVLVVAQARIGHQPPGDDLDPFVFLHAGQQARRVLPAEPPLIGLGEGGTGALQLCHVGGEFRAIGAEVEVGQVPAWQIAKPAPAGIGVENGLGQVQGHRDLRQMVTVI